MRSDIIYVVNHNDFFHEDSFDGIHYTFPKGEKVQVPVDAATHMLGFNMPDKTDVLVRLGWNMRTNPETKKIEQDPDGCLKLAKFVFTKSVTIEAPAEIFAAAPSEEAVDAAPLA